MEITTYYLFQFFIYDFHMIYLIKIELYFNHLAYIMINIQNT